MGMFSKVNTRALGGIGGLFRNKAKAAMTSNPAVAPQVSMDPTATPSNVPMAPQPADSPFAAVATAAMAKMAAKKDMAPPEAAPGKRRFGMLVRPKAY